MGIDSKEAGVQLGRLLVGVTGHRFLAELPKLERAVEQALDSLQSAFPGRSIVVLSALAEGADRLVARAVLRRNPHGLIAILPMPQADYECDFGPDSLLELRDLLSDASEVIHPPTTRDRIEAYGRGGEYVADHADALIALWDGQVAQGRAGTAEVVRRALRRGIPVVHIKAGNREPGTSDATSLGEGQGKIVVHNMPP